MDDLRLGWCGSRRNYYYSIKMVYCKVIFSMYKAINLKYIGLY